MKRWLINAVTFLLTLVLVFSIGVFGGIAFGVGGKETKSYSLAGTVTEQGYGAVGSTTISTEQFIRTFATFGKSYQKGTKMVVTVTKKEYPIFGTFYYYELGEFSPNQFTCLSETSK